jgi:methyl-accepting chemotaxis protein
MKKEMSMAETQGPRSFKFFPKILLTMLGVALIPIGSYWYLDYSRDAVKYREAIARDFQRTSEALVRTVDAWVDQNQRVLRQNAALSDLTSMDPVKQVPILTTIANTYEWLIGASVIRRDGISEARSDGQPPRYLGDREYFQQVMNGQPFGSEVVVTRATGKPGLSLAAPLHDAQQNIVGVLFLMSHLTSVSQAVTDIQIGKSGFAILLDQSGKAIAHGRPEMVKEALQDLRMHPAFRNKQVTGQPAVYEEQGTRKIAYTQKTQQGWTLITQQDYDEAYAPLYETWRYGVILLSVTTGLFTGLAYLLAKRLSNPIRQLTATAEQISLGQLDAVVAGTERGDELGALARAIARLEVSMKMAFSALQKGSVRAS